MTELILNSPGLFKNLIEFEIDGVFVDLHNDYYCVQIIRNSDAHYITLIFERDNPNSRFTEVIVELSDIEIIKMNLSLNNANYSKLTLDSFYRGRFDLNGQLFEHSESGKEYYYIDFYEENCAIELFVNGIKVIFN